MEYIKTPKIENVLMLDRYSRKPCQGTLFLTATHLVFSDPDEKKETWVLHMLIASLEKLPLTTKGSPLLIKTKTFLSVTFVIPKERDCHDVYTTLQQLSQPSDMESLLCFNYISASDNIPRSLGWDFFDLKKEFKRMGVPNEYWSLSLLNENYEVCDTYPRYVYVPATATRPVITGSARFRSKGRFPVLSYLYDNKASISRCSQPLSGFSARCLDDEKMLNTVLRTNPNASFMYVVDTRPKINAMANRAAGKGYENEAFYENIKFKFLGVENIHVMRNSLLKVIETCEQKHPNMYGFLDGIESSGWLKHIKSILDTSAFIADAIVNGINVVVHCSDGWDRTAQVCSLSSLLLDPYYRTISGYQVLIEKDWLSFGHKFSDRCGHIQCDNKEISPIFTQLLDATWQIMQHYPSAFQFNEIFLLTLHDHVHSCQYGTFIGNCEKQRLDLRLSERTYSLWGYMTNYLNDYTNPLYSPEESSIVLKLDLCPQNIRFWRRMYCRFETGVHPREPQSDLLLTVRDHSSSISEHVRYLYKKMDNVMSMITKLSEKKASKPRKNMENQHLVDNKMIYEKKQKKEYETADHDHPLKVKSAFDEDQEPKVSPVILNDFQSVALDWKALRNSNECSCSLPLTHLSKKSHCRKCGDVFCMRCIMKQSKLPGLLTTNSVPVCKVCYDNLSSTTD